MFSAGTNTVRRIFQRIVSEIITNEDTTTLLFIEEIKLLNFSENIKSQPQVAEVEKKCEMCERYEIMQSLLIC